MKSSSLRKQGRGVPHWQGAWWWIVAALVAVILIWGILSLVWRPLPLEVLLAGVALILGVAYFLRQQNIEQPKYTCRQTPKTVDEYRALYRPTCTSAFDKAIDERRFEIELYWKRAAYCWTFIGVAFGAYLALLTSSAPDRKSLALFVACLGFLFSLAWYLVNRGSS